MLAPLLTVGVISYRYYYQAVWEYTTIIADNAIMNLTKEIDGIISTAGHFLEIGSYRASEKYLTGISGRNEPYASAKEILFLMRLYRGRNRDTTDIRDIYLVGINGGGISEREGVFKLQRDFFGTPVLGDLFMKDGETALVKFKRQDLSGYWNKPAWQAAALSGGIASIGLGRAISYSIRKENIGVGVVEINSDHIDDICRKQSVSGNILFSVYDAEGNLLFGDARQSESSDWPEIWQQICQSAHGRFVHILSGKDIFFVFNESKATGLRVVGQADLDAMMEKAYRIRNITMASVCGGIIFTMLLYWFVSDRLTKPIKELQEQMNIAANGNLDVYFNKARTREIASLGNSFNTMICRIKELLTETKREQENLKKAELRTLQAQINPHFLYNTMDSIVWMAQASRYDELITMVMALSMFFRLTLNEGREVVTVAEEIEHARNYLIIQQLRYADIINFEFSVNPLISSCKMIKLTLQPLIENAIYHGLKTKRGGGKIWIEGDFKQCGRIDPEQNNDKKCFLSFSIRDNGSGMSPERLSEVVSNITGTRNKNVGYALRNIYDRMRLLYGADFELTINSEENRGAAIQLIFPALEIKDV
jgi:two-component system sensor histidine kinase YesM